MKSKTKYAVIGLLIVYGLVLAVVSYAVFSKQNKVLVPRVENITKTLEQNALREVSLSVDSSGKLILDANGQQIGGFEAKIILPYDPKYTNLKATVSDPRAKVVLNRTDVNKVMNQIVVSLMVTWDDGIAPQRSVTLATFNSIIPAVSFDRKFTKVFPFGIDGVLPVRLSI